MSDKMVYTIMKNDIITIAETATMKQAADLMRSKRIRHLPVINPSGRIVGILSDRDTRRGSATMNINDFEQTTAQAENHQVKNYMSSLILEVRASDPIGEVVKQMIRFKISCFLVVDEYSAPCGIVTSEDMLKYLVDLIEDRSLELKAPVGTLFQYLRVPTYE